MEYHMLSIGKKEKENFDIFMCFGGHWLWLLPVDLKKSYDLVHHHVYAVSSQLVDLVWPIGILIFDCDDRAMNHNEI